MHLQSISRRRVISPCTAGIRRIWHAAKGLKRKFSGVVQTVELFQDHLGEHSGFSAEALSEFGIYSLCVYDVYYQAALNVDPHTLVSYFLHFCYGTQKHISQGILSGHLYAHFFFQHYYDLYVNMISH